LRLIDHRAERHVNYDPPDSAPEEELRDEEKAQVAAATVATVGKPRRAGTAEILAEERRLLDLMADIAEDARGRPDAKVRHLIDWIRQNMCLAAGQATPGEKVDGAGWNDIRLIVFTEYDDTKRYLQQQLE